MCAWEMKKKDVSLRGTSLGQSSQSRPSQVVKSTEVYTLSPYKTSSHRVCARNYNNIQLRIRQLIANIFQPINLTRPTERVFTLPEKCKRNQTIVQHPIWWWRSSTVCPENTHNWRLVRMARDVTCLCCCYAHLVFLVDHRSRKFTISSECEVHLRSTFQIFRIPT